ncbi:MAG: hypothetical protein KGH58_03360 [Candidatus Micrarchaeota archaeon]|nr:hypothetical protein [Candidatus Micrarchaeota archaeon]
MPVRNLDMARVDTTRSHDLVVVFGDTKLLRSEQRAAAALELKGRRYILLGTEREQDAMEAVLLTKFYEAQGAISRTTPTRSTATNMMVFDSLLHTYTYPVRVMAPDTENPGAVTVAIVTHEGQATRLADVYLAGGRPFADITYHVLKDSVRGLAEHHFLRIFFDSRLANGENAIVAGIVGAREDFKGRVEK